MSDYQMFEAVVRDVEQITPLVKRFTLVSPTGAPLPAFSGGSHIIVQMQDGEQRYSNAYSLMSSPLDTTSWQIAVRLESPSKGGSRFMHQRVRPGAIGSMFMYQRSAAVSTYRACSPTSSQEPTCIPAAQRRLTRR